ncbi:MAG: hypothetical protein ACFB9N_10190 [Geitlerinemataceae cyanobacterium]
MADGFAPQTSAWNQQTYDRLKFKFELGMKRQILVAVCDDWTQTDALAARLQSELAPHVGRGPRLVSLNLHVANPDPLAQIQQWLDERTAQTLGHPAATRRNLTASVPGFQILGAESLTRESATVQWAFLENLRRLPEHLDTLDSSILFWMSRPWRYTIARSTPEFWRCCAETFEFNGEPAPRRVATISIAQASARSDSGQRCLTQPDARPAGFVAPHRERQAPLVLGDGDRQTLNFGELSRTLDPQLVADVRETFHLVASPEADPQHLLVRLFELQRSRASTAELAATYQQLGTIYRDRLDAENPDLRCVKIATQAFECALAGWQRYADVEDIRERQLPALGNDIGALYWMMADLAAETGDRQLCLQHAEAAYRYALSYLSATEQPYARAAIQDRLGSLCSELAGTHDAGTQAAIAAWQGAIAAYEAALHDAIAELDPPQFATLHSNLGTACWNLAQVCEPVAYLERAIAAYEAALHYFTADRDPLNYAMLQTNLGTAAWNLARYGRARDRLEFAIGCYRAALVYRTVENHPLGCASTHNNLGTAYWDLMQTFEPEADREASISSLRQAIAAYETALEIVAAADNDAGRALSFDPSATDDHLGMAYARLGNCLARTDDAPERQHCYERAVASYLRALEGYSTDAPRTDSILEALTTVVRALHDRIGLDAQNRAFKMMSGPISAEVMKRL